MIEGRKKRKCIKKRAYVDPSSDDDFEDEDVCKYLPTRTKSVVESDKKAFIYNVKMSNPAMIMKNIVNHPFTIHCPVYPGTKNIVLNEDIVTQCGKMMVLDAMLTKLKERGHKVCTVLSKLAKAQIFSFNKFVISQTPQIENRQSESNSISIKKMSFQND